MLLLSMLFLSTRTVYHSVHKKCNSCRMSYTRCSLQGKSAHASGASLPDMVSGKAVAAHVEIFAVSGASLPDMVSGKALAAHVELFAVSGAAALPGLKDLVSGKALAAHVELFGVA